MLRWIGLCLGLVLSVLCVTACASTGPSDVELATVRAGMDRTFGPMPRPDLLLWIPAPTWTWDGNTSSPEYAAAIAKHARAIRNLLVTLSEKGGGFAVAGGLDSVTSTALSSSLSQVSDLDLSRVTVLFLGAPGDAEPLLAKAAAVGLRLEFLEMSH